MTLVKVLIVDDSAPVRLVIRSIVVDLDCEVRDCADGLDAVVLFRTWRPDWAVIDVRMPGVDGLTATRLIRAEFPDAQIVVISSHREPELDEAAAAAGARLFLPKSRLNELPAIIEAESAK